MKNKKYLLWGFFISIFIFILYSVISDWMDNKNSVHKKEENKIMEKIISEVSEKIAVTNGIKHTVPLNEILSGGPEKDGIPPIDNPEFLSVSETDFLNNNDEGIAFVDEKNISYFLPFRILVWHEIVNMDINFKGRKKFPISVTYCPLCRTGIIYEALVDGKDTSFGTSGKLWQSNLVMYDRQKNEKNESLWSQVLGQAIVGERAGEKLNIFKSTITNFGTWKKVHKNTKVLSKKTGYFRNYDSDPYGPSYYKGKDIYFPVNFKEEKIHPKELVLGIEIDGSFLAYKKKGLEKIDDTFGSNFISIEKKTDGSFKLLVNKKEYSYVEGFWFSWKSVHPSTILK